MTPTWSELDSNESVEQQKEQPMKSDTYLHSYRSIEQQKEQLIEGDTYLDSNESIEQQKEQVEYGDVSDLFSWSCDDGSEASLRHFQSQETSSDAEDDQRTRSAQNRPGAWQLWRKIWRDCYEWNRAVNWQFWNRMKSISTGSIENSEFWNTKFKHRMPSFLCVGMTSEIAAS